jgi:diacylglycerol kinase family enzyme
MRALLVHNPTAGEGEHSKEVLIDRLHAAELDVVYCSTKSPDFAEECRQPADIAVIAGGDGTVRKTALRLKNAKTPILVLPVGTANNIAQSLGVPNHVGDIAAYLRSAVPRPVDIGIAKGPWGTKSFIEATGCGALAATTASKPGADSDRRERLLDGRRAFFDALKSAEPFESEIEADDVKTSGSWVAIEVLNHSYSGSRLLLAPDADPGDGKFNLFCIAEEKRSIMLDWLAAPESLEPPIETMRCRRVSFEWDGKQPLRLDDRPQTPSQRGKLSKISLRLKKPALRFLLPK